MVAFLTSLFQNTHIFAHIFSSETKIVIFICKLYLQTAKRVCKITEQYMNMQTFCSIKFMNRSFFSKTRYMIGVGLKNWAAHPYQNNTQVTPLPHPLRGGSSAAAPFGVVLLKQLKISNSPVISLQKIYLLLLSLLFGSILSKITYVSKQLKVYTHIRVSSAATQLGAKLHLILTVMDVKGPYLGV